MRRAHVATTSAKAEAPRRQSSGSASSAGERETRGRFGRTASRWATHTATAPLRRSPLWSGIPGCLLSVRGHDVGDADTEAAGWDGLGSRRPHAVDGSCNGHSRYRRRGTVVAPRPIYGRKGTPRPGFCCSAPLFPAVARCVGLYSLVTGAGRGASDLGRLVAAAVVGDDPPQKHNAVGVEERRTRSLNPIAVKAFSSCSASAQASRK